MSPAPLSSACEGLSPPQLSPRHAPADTLPDPRCIPGPHLLPPPPTSSPPLPSSSASSSSTASAAPASPLPDTSTRKSPPPHCSATCTRSLSSSNVASPLRPLPCLTAPQSPSPTPESPPRLSPARRTATQYLGGGRAHRRHPLFSHCIHPSRPAPHTSPPFSPSPCPPMSVAAAIIRLFDRRRASPSSPPSPPSALASRRAFRSTFHSRPSPPPALPPPVPAAAAAASRFRRRAAWSRPRPDSCATCDRTRARSHPESCDPTH